MRSNAMVMQMMQTMQMESNAVVIQMMQTMQMESNAVVMLNAVMQRLCA